MRGKREQIYQALQKGEIIARLDKERDRIVVFSPCLIEEGHDLKETGNPRLPDGTLRDSWDGGMPRDPSSPGGKERRAQEDEEEAENRTVPDSVTCAGIRTMFEGRAWDWVGNWPEQS